MPSKTKYFRYLITFPDPQHPFLDILSNAKGFRCFIFLQITFAPFNPETLPELRPPPPGCPLTAVLCPRFPMANLGLLVACRWFLIADILLPPPPNQFAARFPVLLGHAKLTTSGGSSSVGRASVCGTESRGFKSHLPPQIDFASTFSLNFPASFSASRTAAGRSFAFSSRD